MSEPHSTAVLLMAYGGPDALEDIPAYLLNIRHGRPIPPELLAEITERYRLIGGHSPLPGITQSTAAKLHQRIGLPVYAGMLHWHPAIQDVIPRMAADGARHITGICMAPHYSSMSTGAYRSRLEEATGAAGAPLDVDFVESWHLQPDYLAGIAANVRATLERFSPGERVLVIFSAHSLPAAILERGDPYDSQLRETAARLAELLGLPAGRWMLSYQSAARTGAPWLGPQIEELVVDLARQGEKSLLVAPIGFIAEHVEVLYDLDIRTREIAGAHGVHLERTPMLNDSEPLISALAALAGEHVKTQPSYQNK